MAYELEMHALLSRQVDETSMLWCMTAYSIQHTWTPSLPVIPGIHVNIAVHATDSAQLAEAILFST